MWSVKGYQLTNAERFPATEIMSDIPVKSRTDE